MNNHKIKSSPFKKFISAISIVQMLESEPLVEMLLNQRADPNQATTEGETPLFIGKYIYYIETRLIYIRIKLNYHSRKKAAYTGKDRIFDKMMDKWADVKKTANDGTTVLHAAAAGGNKIIVQKLIDKWLDVNAATRDGITPLMNAVLHNQKDVVEVRE